MKIEVCTCQEQLTFNEEMKDTWPLLKGGFNKKGTVVKQVQADTATS